MDVRSDNEATVSMPSDREIVIVRDFAAPKSVVFDAWSKPELVQRWYPCSTLTMPVCEIDLRVGGKWRWLHRSRYPIS
jgi:uncharacterized protein YndB with AHSA1/START domain